jgi:hypothetical protein|tara:strand:+ start:158 stop:388 length:231 start_codon:yes stop_codon:yes gene_type:complete
LTSKNSSKPWTPASLPIPECLYPPNGASTAMPAPAAFVFELSDSSTKIFYRVNFCSGVFINAFYNFKIALLMVLKS